MEITTITVEYNINIIKLNHRSDRLHLSVVFKCGCCFTYYLVLNTY